MNRAGAKTFYLTNKLCIIRNRKWNRFRARRQCRRPSRFRLFLPKKSMVNRTRHCSIECLTEGKAGWFCKGSFSVSPVKMLERTPLGRGLYMVPAGNGCSSFQEPCGFFLARSRTGNAQQKYQGEMYPDFTGKC